MITLFTWRSCFSKKLFALLITPYSFLDAYILLLFKDLILFPINEVILNHLNSQTSSHSTLIYFMYKTLTLFQSPGLSFSSSNTCNKMLS